MRIRVVDDRKIFNQRQYTRRDADALVITQAARADRQKITLKDNLAVHRGVRLVENQKYSQRATDLRDVITAARKTQPRRIVVSRNQHVDHRGHKKGSRPQAEANETFLRIWWKEENVDQRYQ